MMARKFFSSFVAVALLFLATLAPAWAGETMPGDVLVVFKAVPGTTVTDETLAEGGADAVRVAAIAESLGARVVEIYVPLSEAENEVFALLHSDTKDETVLMEELQARDDVSGVSLNHVSQGNALPVPPTPVNPVGPDPFLTEGKLWGLGAVCAPAAWTITSGDPNVYVAVIDSGVDYDHPDLKDNFETEGFSRNFDPTATPLGPVPSRVDLDWYHDENGHGTHVAGIIGARGNNARGGTGVAQRVKIIALRAEDATGHGSSDLTVKALTHVLDILKKNPTMKLAAVNISLGGFDKTPPAQKNDKDPYWKALSAVSKTNRTVICVAAGNEGMKVGEPAPSDGPDKNGDGNPDYFAGDYCYPASFLGIDNMIVVANAQKLKGDYPRNSGSNYSQTYVDLAAPGSAIWSTLSTPHHSSHDAPVLAPLRHQDEDGCFYMSLDGTSMAAPFVAGAAALLFSAYPNATASVVKKALLDSANTDFATDYTAHGFLNVKGALEYLPYLTGESVKPPMYVGIPIDEHHFPDPVFRSYVEQFDKPDKNGWLSKAEIAQIRSINVANKGISSLDGVQYFTALTTLDCSNNKGLVELDVVNECMVLTDLNCSNTGLTLFDLRMGHPTLATLDLSGCTSLVSVDCQNSKKLATLNVSGNVALEELSCQESGLISLNVHGCKALTELYCHKNKLTLLDVSDCVALKILSCWENILMGLTLGGTYPKLEELYCNDNVLTQLDISRCPALVFLDCSNNNLATLDISRCPNLTNADDLNCSGQKLYGLTFTATGDATYPWSIDLSSYVPTGSLGNIVPNSIVGYTEAGIILYAGDLDTTTGVTRLLKTGTITYEPDVVKYKYRTTAPTDAARSGDGFLMEVTIEAGPAPTTPDSPVVIPVPVAIDAAHFPDANFREYVSQNFDKDRNGTLSVAEINAAKTLYVSRKRIARLDGIQYFTALENLSCGDNALVSLDVSKNTSLTRLSCDGNKLTALDVSKNTSLTRLSCDGNQLTELDVSKNISLTWLECAWNQLTALDVSKNTSLTGLWCDNNQLTALNVSKNTSLTRLSCGGNKRNKLTELDVSKNTSLTTLDCGGNQITTLDVSKNTSLTTLDCGLNHLTALDVSKNTSLTTLDCGVNQITVLDVSNNTSLTTLDCGGNQLTALDVSKNTSLTTLDCDGNQLTTLDVSKNMSLTRLSCDRNKLTELDVSKNTSLTTLECGGNQLTALDVSRNTELTNLVCFSQEKAGLVITESNGRCEANLASILIGMGDVSKVSSVKGYSSSYNITITTSYDATTGIAVFDSRPRQVKYDYDTGMGMMDVTLSVSATKPTITTSALPDGSVGTAYDFTLTATGTTPITWSASGLPDGLSCSNAGIISGTPTTVGYHSPTVTATNSEGSVTKDFTLAISGKASPLPITEANFPDAGFRQYLSQQFDGNGDGTLSPEEIAAVTTMDLSGKGITSLEGIQRFTNLASLNCSNNALVQLDIKGLPALTRIECANNQLTELDTSGLASLEYLDCSSNALTSLNVTGCPVLAYLDCSGNMLPELDVTECPKLAYLDCFGNQLTALDISSCTDLGYLDCASNEIAVLDVTHCPALETLKHDEDTLIIDGDAPGGGDIDDPDDIPPVTPPSVPDTAQGRVLPGSGGKTVTIEITLGSIPVPGEPFLIWLRLVGKTDHIGPFVGRTDSSGQLTIDVDALFYADGPNKGQKAYIDAGEYVIRFVDEETQSRYVGTTGTVRLEATKSNGGGGGGCAAWSGALGLLALATIALRKR